MSRQSMERDVRRMLLRSGRRFLLCVSGGADSIALLQIAARVPDVELVVAHCNFHLRGEESEGDCRFVQEVCSSLGMKLLIRDFDVDTYAKSRGVSVEMACRDLRYEWFRQLKENLQLDRIVVAHNADDNIETLFLNLFRGTGIRGLAGMGEDDGEVLRPLLRWHRADIEAYLERNGFSFRTDSTNLSNDFQRNYIRNVLLPSIEERWPSVRRVLTRNQEVFRAECAQRVVGEDVSQDLLPWSAMEGHGDCFRTLWEFASQRGFSVYTTREMSQCAGRHKVGCRWFSKLGEICSTREGFRFQSQNEVQRMPECRFEELQLDDEEWANIRGSGNDEVWLPKGRDAYHWRHPHEGERIASMGMKGTQLMSRVLHDAGVDVAARKGVWVLADKESDEAVWIPGIKRSRRHLVDNGAKMAWRVTLL